MTLSENKRKMLAGELYHAFDPELIEARARCKHACNRFNNAGEVSRRRQVELWRDIVQDPTPLPPPSSTSSSDEVLSSSPWIEPPIRIDYGFNVRLSSDVFINFNCTILDTCLVSIGARTLVGPNVSFFSGTHPLDPGLRDGTNGPEMGKEIVVEEDVWIGGNVVVLPGVRLGKGCVVGAGSVVTKSVAPYCIVAGNPARVLRKLQPDEMTGRHGSVNGEELSVDGAEKPMQEDASSEQRLRFYD